MIQSPINIICWDWHIKERDHPFQQLQCVAAEEPYHDDEQKENQGDRTNQVSVIYPLALALMIVSNIEAVARTTKSIAQEVMQTVEEQMEPENAVAVKESTSSPQAANHISQPQESGIAEQPAQEESRSKSYSRLWRKCRSFRVA